MIEAGRPRPPVGETLPPSVRAVLDRLDLRRDCRGGRLSAFGRKLCRMGRGGAVGPRFPVQQIRPWLAYRPPPLRCAAARGGARRRRAARGRQRGDRIRRRSPAAGFAWGWPAAARSRRGWCWMAPAAPRAVRASARRGAASARPHGGDHRLCGAPAGCRAGAAATLVEAAEGGWWYSAPLPQHRLAVAFMTDSDLVRTSMTSPQAWFDGLMAATHTAARVAGYGAGLAGPPVDRRRGERPADAVRRCRLAGDRRRRRDPGPVVVGRDFGGDDERRRRRHRRGAAAGRRPRRIRRRDGATRTALARLSR